MRNTANSVRKNTQRGSAMLELSISLPLLLLILFGVADFGRFMYAAIEINSAASAGAEYATTSLVNSTDYAGMQTAAQADAADVSGVTVTTSSYCKCLGGSVVSCTVGACGGTSTPPNYIKVTTSGTFNTLFSYPGLPSSIALSGSAIRRIQ